MSTLPARALLCATVAIGLSAASVALATPANGSLQHRGGPRANAERHDRSADRDNGPVLQVLTRVEQSLRTTRYVHVTHVDARAGVFEWDCSGMAAWVLSRAAPRAEQMVLARNSRGRPVASDYYDVITRAPNAPERNSHAWQRVERIEDARAGDVIAWRRPRWIASNNTGHVAFVVSPARLVNRGRSGEYYEVRVADATSILHADDTRGAGPRRSGFGYGTLAFRVDPVTHQGVAYGWFGRQTEWYVPTPIAIGRPLR